MLLTTSPIPSTFETAASLVDLNQPLPPAVNNVDTILGILCSLVVLLPLLWQVWKHFIKPYRTYTETVDAHYTKPIRKMISKCYIPTRAQDIDPCDQDEIRENNGKFISKLLIPFFRNEAFPSSSHGKYYLVLADSGMGKSTFILRLYHDYLLAFSFRKKKPIALIPLAYKNCLNTIQNITDKGNTILLLDGLDENPAAIKNYQSFLRDLLDATEEFYKVVITCRTQFFPNRASEPNLTGNVRVGTGNKATEIIKKYLSPFSDAEVKLYLRKRYRFKRKTQQKAYAIVQKVPTLMARPVILNWMDFLCDSSQEYDFTFLIYTTILDKWIEREKFRVPGPRLRELSLAVAEYMFINRTTSMPAAMVEEIAARKGIEIEPIIAKSRSLLNRNSDGEYKFAHRSFLEYLTVYSIFTKKYSPEVMKYALKSSGAKRFLFEILLHSSTLTDFWSTSWKINHKEDAKNLLNTERLLEILLGDDLDMMIRLTERGFIVVCWTHMLKSEIWDPDRIMKVGTDAFTFVDSEPHRLISERITELKLEFVVEMKNRFYSIQLSMQCDGESPVL